MYQDAVFEWDVNKNAENIVKHGISFEEGKNVFTDERRILLVDKKHSQREPRMYSIGKIEGKIVMVRFVY